MPALINLSRTEAVREIVDLTKERGGGGAAVVIAAEQLRPVPGTGGVWEWNAAKWAAIAVANSICPEHDETHEFIVQAMMAAFGYKNVA